MTKKLHTKLRLNSICSKEPAYEALTPSHILPLYATSSFSFDNIDDGIEMFAGRKKGHTYTRYGNPTSDSIASKIAALESIDLEESASALMVASGMAAIHTVMFSLLKSGDKVITQSNLYGGSAELFKKTLEPLGIGIIMNSFQDYDAVEDLIKKDKAIKVMYLETPTNPVLTCIDLQKSAEIAQRHGLKTVVDNTFCSPVIQRPFNQGIDFIIHSTTKYLNGHGNSIAGIIIGKDIEFMRQKVWSVMKLTGTHASPFDSWLLHHGIKTLHLRMERHSQNAMALATLLSKQKSVAHVNYPGLTSHPQFDLASRQMNAGGGMLSFEIKGGFAEGKKFMNKTKMCTLAPTLGDIDTLLLHPASMSHLNIPKDVREAAGITDGLIRLSVGIEDIHDLEEDILQALEA